MQKNTKDPRGGLTAEGRREFARKEGARLRPGVRGKADTGEKKRRKGSFLRRMFAHDGGPLVDEQGEPTRRALSAHAWGERVPKTKRAAKKLAKKGARLLDQYKKERSMAATKKQSTKKSGTKKTGGKKSGTKKTGGKKSGTKKAGGKKGTKKNSLVANINRRKKKGTSRPKSKSTVSAKSYRDMKKGWPRSKKKGAKKRSSRS